MFERPPTSQSELLEIGRALAEDIEKEEAARIKLESFRGTEGFSNEEIDRDMRFEKDASEKFERIKSTEDPIEMKQIHESARIMELLLPLAIQDYGWLGKNTNRIHVSLYDDFVNGVDSGMQLIEPEETENLGMEIDFTSSEAAMGEKVLKIVKSIQSGKVTVVKYFDSPTTGKLKNVEMPKIAFGAPLNEIIECADAFVEARKNPRSELLRKSIEDHPLKKKFLSYTVNQLREFLAIATKAKNEKSVLLHKKLLEVMKKRGLIADSKE